jgi:hypothetical protein
MVARGSPKRELSFIAGELEMDKIEAVFTELKLITGLKKTELYGKALLWIASDEKAKAKFIEYLENEKAKTQIMEIEK